MAIVETSSRDPFDIRRNHQVAVASKVTNQVSPGKVNQEIIGNPQKSVPGINRQTHNTGVCKGETSHLTNAGPERKGVKGPTISKCKVPNHRNFGTGFECQSRKSVAITETVSANCFN
jgi:hypothetical protein